MSRPALSVVVPSRNTRLLTLACLDSLAAERDAGSTPGLEVVLVDDAGTDGTAVEAAGRHPWVRLVRLPAQAGFTRAANRGMAEAAGEVLLLLNSDTEVDRGSLEALLAVLAARPRLGIAGAALRYPDGTAQWSGGGEPGNRWLFGVASGLPALAARLPFYRRLRPASGTAAHPGGGGGAGAGAGDGGGGGGGGAAPPVRVAWVTGAALAVRREVWEAVGPLDERFRLYAQDLDLCLRAGDAGWEVAVVPAFTVVHHHGATVTAEGARRSAGGGRGAQQAELLWLDLVRWAGKRHGARGARGAARALAAGGGLRLLARRLAAPLLLAAPAARRRSFREDTRALARAMDAVAALRERAFETC